MGTKPQCCIVAEDAVNGVKAAKNAGMACIGITTTFASEELKAAGADYICSDIKEIYDVVVSIKE